MFSRSVVSDTLRPFGLQPARLLCPWGFSGKNTGVGCHFSLLHPNPGIEPMSAAFPALQAGSLPAEPSGKPLKLLNCVAFSLLL